MEKLELKEFKKAIQSASSLVYELSVWSGIDIDKTLELIRLELEILRLKNDIEKLS